MNVTHAPAPHTHTCVDGGGGIGIDVGDTDGPPPPGVRNERLERAPPLSLSPKLLRPSNNSSSSSRDNAAAAAATTAQSILGRETPVGLLPPLPCTHG